MGMLATSITSNKWDIITEQKMAIFIMAVKRTSTTQPYFGVQRKLSQPTCTALIEIKSVLKQKNKDTKNSVKKSLVCNETL
jgi:hypothetical protein